MSDPLPHAAHLRRCADDDIDSLLHEPGTVIVEYATDWCLPCRLLRPVMAKLAVAFRNSATFVAVDADESERFRAIHDLVAFPQVLVFRDGVLVDRRIGHDTPATALAFLAVAIDPGHLVDASPADRQFARAAEGANAAYRSSVAPLEAEVDRRMDAVAPVMDALVADLKIQQEAGLIDARGAMMRQKAEWERVSAPFRDRLDALRATTAAALAAYEASMAEALGTYAAASVRPAMQACGPNDPICRLRLGAE